MRLALTGATGLVGRHVLAAAAASDLAVLVLGRRPPADGLPPGAAFRPWALGERPDLSGTDALVHAAFAHVPGRYRGGEGDDAAGFLRSNRDGSLLLAETARAQGLRAALFLSSRAVFDGYPPGSRLAEDLPPRPTSLYGTMKAEVEAGCAALARPGFATGSLRPTGVYGLPAPGGAGKWDDLIRAVIAGTPVSPRVAGEVHGDDLARAVLLHLAALRADPAAPSVTHAADIVLDHRDLAARVAAVAGRADPLLPPAADPTGLSLLSCARLHALGWRPGGFARLDATLPAMVARLLPP